MVTYSTKDARDNFSEVVNRATFSKERIALERRGKVVAFIVPPEDVDELEALEEAADVAEANRIMEDVRAGRETLIPWEDVKKELAL